VKTGDTILEVDELVDGIGYSFLTTDQEKPICRFHLTQECFDGLAGVPLTLVGAKIKVFAFAEEFGTLHAHFEKPNGDSVTWRMTDPFGENFKSIFDGKQMEVIPEN
jgi:hypothetical protein